MTTIHDLIYRRFPETHAPVLARGLGALVWLAARRSARVIAPSQAVKADIRKFLHVQGDLIDVTNEGPGLPDAPGTSEQAARKTLDLGDAPIVLSVSAKRPHKNLERLIEAFGRVDARGVPPVLVVPGYPTFYESTLRGKAGERVLFAGWLDDDLLDALYRAATCFVFPSLAEGFGLPVLDALHRGVPVATSNAASLPEVAGDAALYFDPEDTDAIADAIRRLLTDEALRGRLQAAGPRQAAKFSWEKTARATLDSYRRAVS